MVFFVKMATLFQVSDSRRIAKYSVSFFFGYYVDLKFLLRKQHTQHQAIFRKDDCQLLIKLEIDMLKYNINHCSFCQAHKVADLICLVKQPFKNVYTNHISPAGDQ